MRWDTSGDARAARWRLAWDHARKAQAIANELERDPHATLPVEGGVAVVEAWRAFCEADQEYRILKEREACVDEG